MELIKIVQHEEAVPLKDRGDILRPSSEWKLKERTTGGRWYSKIPEEFYDNKSYLPLTAVAQNSWTALEKLGVDFKDFQKQVEYICPYNKYAHFWSVPILIFTNDIKNWTVRHKIPREEMYLDEGWMRNYFPPKVRDALPFTKIQRALLGPGYTEMTLQSDGQGFLYDALIALDNGDFLGAKVWMWFNK